MDAKESLLLPYIEKYFEYRKNHNYIAARKMLDVFPEIKEKIITDDEEIMRARQFYEVSLYIHDHPKLNK